MKTITVSFKKRERKVLAILQVCMFSVYLLHTIFILIDTRTNPFSQKTTVLQIISIIQISYFVFTLIAIIIRKKSYTNSKLVTLSVFTASLLQNAIFHGNENAIGMITIAFLIGLFLLFDQKETKMQNIFVIINIFVYIINEVISRFFLEQINLHFLNRTMESFRDDFPLSYYINSVAGSIGIFIGMRIFLKDTRVLFKKVDRANHRYNNLLHEIFPSSVVESLYNKKIGQVLSWYHPKAAVLMADICSFTESVKTLTPEQLVKELNTIYNIFDNLAEKHSVHKIKTIGDGYLAVCGVPEDQEYPEKLMAGFAEDVIKAIYNYRQNSLINGLDIRIGIDSGELISGVLGESSQAYDIWGNCVNKASRLESTGKAGYIHISEHVYNKLSDKSRFHCIEQMSMLKGFGKEKTFLLKIN